MSLEGRVALVTGGGRGIGKGISLALARDGADIAINYRRNEEAAKETAAEVRALGQRAELYPCDVSESYERVREMVERIVADFGKIDVLVNNAGIASRGSSVYDTEIPELQRVINTHMYGAYYCTKAVLDTMRQQGRGDIVYISSGAAESCGANGSPYNMAKAAQEALAKTIAKEERKNGIRVNVIRAGLVETEMGRRLVRATRGVTDMKELYPTSPFGRVGQPYDIGNAVAFLVSEGAEYVTNQIISVNGGGF